MKLKSYILLNKKGQSSFSVSEAQCHNCSSKQDGHVWKGHGTPCSPNGASGVPGRALSVASQKSAEEQLLGAVRPVLRPLSSPTVNTYVNICAAMCRYTNMSGRHILLPYNTNIDFTSAYVARFCILYTSTKHDSWHSQSIVWIYHLTTLTTNSPN